MGLKPFGWVFFFPLCLKNPSGFCMSVVHLKDAFLEHLHNPDLPFQCCLFPLCVVIAVPAPVGPAG